MKLIDVFEYLKEYLGSDIDQDCFIHLYNMVEDDISYEYFPLITEEIFDCTSVFYKDFRRHPIRIISCDSKYKLDIEKIRSIHGNKLGRIKYSYKPEGKTHLTDECSYDDSFKIILSCGVMQEYKLSLGLYEDASWWGNQYKQNIKSMFESECVK